MATRRRDFSQGDDLLLLRQDLADLTFDSDYGAEMDAWNALASAIATILPC